MIGELLNSVIENRKGSQILFMNLLFLLLNHIYLIQCIEELLPVLPSCFWGWVIQWRNTWYMLQRTIVKAQQWRCIFPYLGSKCQSPCILSPIFTTGLRCRQHSFTLQMKIQNLQEFAQDHAQTSTYICFVSDPNLTFCLATSQ